MSSSSKAIMVMLILGGAAFFLVAFIIPSPRSGSSSAAPSPTAVSSGQRHFGDGGPSSPDVRSTLSVITLPQAGNCAAWRAAQTSEPDPSWKCQDVDGGGILLFQDP